MNIILYRNTSDAHVADKSLTELATVSGVLRSGSSILDPSLAMEFDGNPPAFNYIYIPAFGRYYFVNNVSSIVNNLWAIAAHVDVLTTYISQLRQLSCVVARQENSYNLYLDDDKFPVTSKRIYWTKAFPNRVPAASPEGYHMILTLAGGSST